MAAIIRNELKSDNQLPMRTKKRIEQFVEREGRRPRVLVSNMNQRSHDQDSKLLAAFFAEAGFDVDISPLNQTPQSTAWMAIENDVHIICFLSSNNNHKKLVTELATALKAESAEKIRILIGGAIPETDYDFLYGAGAAQIFNSVLLDAEAVNQLLDLFE